MGHFLYFFMLLRKFPCLKESDDMLCPCWSLRLDDKDQRHVFYRGGSCLYDKGLGLFRRLLLPDMLGVPGSFLSGGSWELCRKVFVGAHLPSLGLLC